MARRTKQDALATRDALLDAAERVFEARGVGAASLQDVAEEAGVTRGALYWHFKDKADLFSAMMSRVTLPFEQRWSAPALAGTDPLQVLRERVVANMELIATSEQVLRVFTIATHRIAYVGELEALMQRKLKVRDNLRGHMESLLRQAQTRGQVAPHVDAKHAAIVLDNSVFGLLHHWTLAPGSFDLLAVTRLALDALLAGFQASASDQSPVHR